MRSTECADLGALAFPGSSPARDGEESEVCANPAPRYVRGLPALFRDEAHLMERLWIREVRRAARRVSAPFARQVALGCGAAAVGTMVASLLPMQWDGVVAQAVWAALWAAAGYVVIWTGLFIYHLWRYRSSGFRDRDWVARHDDSDPEGALFLELVRRSGAGPHPGVDLELWVKSHGSWEVVDDDDLVVMPDKAIRCRFDLNHEVFGGSFYDVRWFRADDRGKLIEITRERFQMRNHSVGRRTGSRSQAKPRLAPKALPITEDEIKPRRLAPEAVASGDEISPRRAVEAR